MSFHLDDLDSMANFALALTQVKDPWTNTQSQTYSHSPGRSVKGSKISQTLSINFGPRIPTSNSTPKLNLTTAKIKIHIFYFS